MVRRQKEAEIAGVLEFEGRTSEDPEFQGWLADHRLGTAGRSGSARAAQACA